MKKSRVILWVVTGALSLTGIALHFMAPATYGDLPHPLSGLFRELHGVAAALAIFMLGYMFADHAQNKILKRSRQWARQIWDGYLHLSTWLLLLITGLLLYYPQPLLEDWQMAGIHWYLGLLLSILFPLHFWRKKFKFSSGEEG